MSETPPWRWEKFDDSYGGNFWALKDAEVKAIIHLVDGEDSNLTEQRMRLIAAAPEMYKALRAALDRVPERSPFAVAVRDLLARIDGKDPP